MDGKHTLATRWGAAENTLVEGEAVSSLFNAKIMRTRWKTVGEEIFNPRWAFVQMFYKQNRLVTAALGDRRGREGFVHHGSIFYVPQGAELHCRWTPGVQRALHCMFDLQNIGLKHGLEGAWDADYGRDSLHVDNELVSVLMRRISEEVKTPRFGSDIFFELAFLNLAIELCWRPSAPGQEDRAAALTRSELATIREAFLDADGPPPTIAEVAQLLGMNSRLLARSFREMTGYTLRSFAANCRLERAKGLLVGTRMPIKQIAFRAGFRSFTSFCGAFRREMGQSPSQFRQAAR